MQQPELPPLEQEIAGKNYLGLLCLSAIYEGKMGELWDKLIREGRTEFTETEVEAMNALRLRHASIRGQAKIIHAMAVLDDPKSNSRERYQASWVMWMVKVNKAINQLMPDESEQLEKPVMTAYSLEIPPGNMSIEWYKSQLPLVLPGILQEIPTPDGTYMTTEEFLSNTQTVEGVDL